MSCQRGAAQPLKLDARPRGGSPWWRQSDAAPRRQPHLLLFCKVALNPIHLQQTLARVAESTRCCA
eukprot:1161700-Pelagomonas_calceolata.AAC.5